jgi:2'-5' RNA ligase
MKIRAFIAFELKEEETIKNLSQFVEKLKQHQPKMKAVEPENFHLTVKFLGNIEETQAKKIYEIIENDINNVYFKEGEKQYRLKGTGQFNRYSTIWVKLRGDTQVLQEIKDILEELLKRELNIQKDRRKEFKAHLTIGRLKSNKINYKNFDTFKGIIKEQKNLDFGEFKIDKLLLKKSDLTPKGPIYTTLTY